MIFEILNNKGLFIPWAEAFSEIALAIRPLPSSTGCIDSKYRWEIADFKIADAIGLSESGLNLLNQSTKDPQFRADAPRRGCLKMAPPLVECTGNHLHRLCSSSQIVRFLSFVNKQVCQFLNFFTLSGATSSLQTKTINSAIPIAYRSFTGRGDRLMPSLFLMVDMTYSLL